MKATITIHFEKINGFIVNKRLLEVEPKLKGLTEKTIKEVCKNLEKYFKEMKINVKTESIVE